MMKKIAPILILVALFLCGCTEETAPPEETTINTALNNGNYGIYLLKEDKSLEDPGDQVIVPLNPYATSPVEDNQSHNFFWWTTDKEKYTPTLTKNSKLIAIYDSVANMPEEYKVEKFQFLGYSIGSNISVGDDNSSLWIGLKNFCTGSNAEETFADLETSDETMEISKINGEENLPISNVDTDINTLIGLERNKIYEFTFYVGTKTRSKNIYADTQIFKSRGTIDLSANPVIKTDYDYFIINLPENISKGYYQINDEGIFKVKNEQQTSENQ